MRHLRFVVLFLALLAPMSTPYGIPWGALARAGGAAAKVERAAAAAVSMERAGASVAKAGLGAERAAAALSAEQRAATLASEAKTLGLQRAKDGRFLLSAGAASAKLVHRRVFSSILESPPAVLMRAADGRFTRIAGLATQGPALIPGLVLVADSRAAAGPNDAMIGHATQALADAVATAFREAVFEVQAMEESAGAKGGQSRAPPNRVAQMMALTKQVLRAMQDDTVLFDAQNASAAREAGYRGATLWDVKAVYLFEEKKQPTALWIELADMPNQTKKGYLARVDLDEVLAQIPKDGL